MKRYRLQLLVILFVLGGSAFHWWWGNRLERSQDAPIRAAAQRYGVEPALVKAIVWRESRFRPEVHGHAGELGLMQLQEDAAWEWASAEHVPGFVHEQCLDPVTNTLAGTFYLRRLLRHYTSTDNPVPYALAEYNAGRGNVLKWLGGAATTNSATFIEQIGFPGTKEYVKEVLGRYKKYRQWF